LHGRVERRALTTDKAVFWAIAALALFAVTLLGRQVRKTGPGNNVISIGFGDFYDIDNSGFTA
jgi:hypothetical protein